MSKLIDDLLDSQFGRTPAPTPARKPVPAASAGPSVTAADAYDVHKAPPGVCPRCRADGLGHSINSRNDTHTCAKYRGTKQSVNGTGHKSLRPPVPEHLRGDASKSAAVRFGDGPVTVQPKPAQFNTIDAITERGQHVRVQVQAVDESSRPSREGVTDEWATPGFSAIDDQRIGRDETALREAGFSLQSTVYTRGELVNMVGVKTARAKRAEWAGLPRPAPGLMRIIDLVRAENRRTCTVAIPELHMDARGWVGSLSTGEHFAMDREALPQLFQRVAMVGNMSSPGGAMVGWTSPELVGGRVATFNAMCKHVAVESGRAVADYKALSAAQRRKAGKAPVVPTMVLRVRDDAGGVPSVFAAVSKRYAAVDADMLADACLRACNENGGDLRVDTFYDRRVCNIKMLAHSNVKPENCGVGETFQVGVDLRTRDDGKGGIDISVVAFRNRCRNYYIIDEAVIRLAVLRHIGDAVRLGKEVAEHLSTAFAKVSHFTRAWSESCARPLWTANIPSAASAIGQRNNVRAERGSEKLLGELLQQASLQHMSNELRDELLAGTFRGMAERKVLPIGTRAIEDLIPEFIAAHDDKRNDGSALVRGRLAPTYASVSNAVSLWAHEQDNATLELDLEAAAGRILSMTAPLPWVASRDVRA